MLNATVPIARSWKKPCSYKDDAGIMLNRAAEGLKLTARSYHRLLRTARTVADLAARRNVTSGGGGRSAVVSARRRGINYGKCLV